MSKQQWNGKFNFPLVIAVFTVIYLLGGLFWAIIGTYAVVLRDEYLRRDGEWN